MIICKFLEQAINNGFNDPLYVRNKSDATLKTNDIEWKALVPPVSVTQSQFKIVTWQNGSSLWETIKISKWRSHHEITLFKV